MTVKCFLYSDRFDHILTNITDLYVNGMFIFETLSDAGSINLTTRLIARDKKKHKRHLHKMFRFPSPDRHGYFEKITKR